MQLDNSVIGNTNMAAKESNEVETSEVLQDARSIFSKVVHSDRMKYFGN
jgi:hypothetical protein